MTEFAGLFQVFQSEAGAVFWDFESGASTCIHLMSLGFFQERGEVRRKVRQRSFDSGRTHAGGHPIGIRHNAATFIPKEFGLDAARAILGHSSSEVPEVYSELDREKVMEVMVRVG